MNKLLVFISLLFSLFFLQSTAAHAQTVNPFGNTELYVDTDSQAYRTYNQLKQSNHSEAAEVYKIASTPQAAWFGGWNANVQADVNTYVSNASGSNALPVLVAYNIPMRDCSGHSSGGANTPEEYREWITQFAAGIGDRKAVVILEPDGLGLIGCWPEDGQQSRLSLYRYALDTLTLNPNVSVYIDASMWVAPQDMAELLQQAGIQKARGIAVNTANNQSTEASTTYIASVRDALGLNIYGIIDTSRNGAGSDSNGEWCNPLERALGNPSTSSTNNPIIDAFYWIKRPGESDGTCNGGPSAGAWWQAYAIDLAQRSPFFDETNTNLSTLKIYAAGTPAHGAYPNMELLINGMQVKTIHGIGGNPYFRNFTEYTYMHEGDLQPQDVQIRFINDLSANGEDRNLVIDKIAINGNTFETESPATFSLGSWNSQTGCDGGYKQSEWLHCNGYVQFAGDTIAVTPTSTPSITFTPTPTATPTPTPSPTPSPTPTPTPSAEPIPNEDFVGQYFSNRTLAGNPTGTRQDAKIDFDWGGGSPAAAIPSDNFSVRWTKVQTFTEGNYKFMVTADDGVRLYIDNNLVIDEWKDQAAKTYTVSKKLAEGDHEIKIEYYEHGGGAVMKFAMAEDIQPTPPPPGAGYQVQYFNTRDLSGAVAVSRFEESIDYDWGGGSPAQQIQGDSFSARWIKQESFAAGSYTFTVSGDDGYRVYLDDEKILDRWQDQPPTTTSVTKTITEGTHTIRVEYYENSGGALMKFRYLR